MATETFYERRMKDLEIKKVQHNVASNPLLQRPTNIRTTGLENKPSQPENEDPFKDIKDTPFFSNVERFKQEDPKFGGIMESYTNLAMGLKAEVDNGFMPRQIAEQRLYQFIQDHRKSYGKAPEQSKVEGGMLSQVTPPNQPQSTTEAPMQSEQGVSNGNI